MRKKILYLMGVSLLFFLLSCGKEVSPVGFLFYVTELASEQGAQLLPISNWTAGEMEQPTLTLQFSEDKISGFSGANRYFGSVTMKGKQLTIGAIASTRRLSGSEKINRLETHFLQLLQTVTEFRYQGEVLTLYNGEKKAVIVLKKFDLVGTSWNLIAYNNGKEAIVSLGEGEQAKIEFTPHQILSGENKGEQFQAVYHYDGKTSLTIADLNKQETTEADEFQRNFYRLLEQSTTISIDGELLQISDKENRTLLILSH